MMASFQRSNSHDKVRKIVAEEGRTARNLIAWSVPLENKEDDGKSKWQSGGKTKRVTQGTHKTAKQNSTLDCKLAAAAGAGDKSFDKSPTKARQPRKVDLRARYWAFLFDNLRRAVDEIYVTCESDQSVVECKEVLMMLDNYVRDFKALIDWIQLQEKLEKADAQSRPTSLAWEVKKMSPGRHVIPSPSTDRISVTSNARRSLNFGNPAVTISATRLAPSGVSWADKVKANHGTKAANPELATAQACLAPPAQKALRKNDRKDAEGWETVQRGRPVRSRSTALAAKAPAAAESLKSRGDSDKENVLSPPAENKHGSSVTGSAASESTELVQKDPLHHSEGPLTEKAQEHLSLKKYIVDIVIESSVPVEPLKDGEEKQKIKKKAKKLKARMNSRAKEYESLMEAKNAVSDSPFKAKLQRLAKDLLKHLQMQDGCSLGNHKVPGLDRTLGEISRILEKENTADKIAFRAAGGLTALENVLQMVTSPTNLNAAARVPFKSLCSTVNVYSLTCSNCIENCTYVLFSNKITFLMDLLIHQFTVSVPDDHNATAGRSVNKQVFEGLTTGLLRVAAVIFRCLISSFPDGNSHSTALKILQEVKSKSSQVEAFSSRVQDLISYVVNMGLVDKLCCCFLSVQGPVDENPNVASFLQSATAVLHGMCQLCWALSGRWVHSNGMCQLCRVGSLFQCLQPITVAGELQGVLPPLLAATASSKGESSPKDSYAASTVQVAIQSLRFFNSFALLDLPAFQSIVGAEGLSLAFRHIISSLLWYCSQHTCEGLLHEVIICVGYFTVNNPDNQIIVQSGRHPTVLQKLCQLPFQYFSDPRLIKVLFPSLIAACYNNPQNKIILEQEMSCVLLATFIQDFAQSSGQMENQLSQQREKFFSSQDYLELSNRFPRQSWEEARQFFLKK
uniref:S phase cyclin A-associated protein in the endoplasmic reticulum N-terminal domain-containing protein n=1 Tax=Zonotrichia albicollis TaxID=44394 RepID=A0A8D2QJA5_ZONAL